MWPILLTSMWNRVPHPPRDLHDQGLQVLLAQHDTDLPGHSRLAFVLVDVEFHPAAPSWQMEPVRCPIYVHTVLSRHQILRVMDVFLYAQFVQDTCLVWHNGIIVSQDAGLYVRLYHGDYIRIALPPPLTEMRNVPTRCIARMLQMAIAPVEPEAFYWVSNVDDDLEPMPAHFLVVSEIDSSTEGGYSSSSSSTTSLLQTSMRSTSRGRKTTHHRWEEIEAVRMQYLQHEDPALTFATTATMQDLPWFERDLIPLWESAARTGPGGMNREKLFKNHWFFSLFD